MWAVALLLASTSAWTEVSRTDDLVVYRRERAGSDIHEIMAVGWLDASPERVVRVLDDGERFTAIMPSTKECRLVKREGGVSWWYERIAPPIVAQRDYTVKITRVDVAGAIHHVFSLDNAVGPAPVDGVVRVPILEGRWELVAVGQRTRATYRMYTSSGGDLPSWMINIANSAAPGEIFGAVRKALPSKRYDEAAPATAPTTATARPAAATAPPATTE